MTWQRWWAYIEGSCDWLASTARTIYWITIKADRVACKRSRHVAVVCVFWQLSHAVAQHHFSTHSAARHETIEYQRWSSILCCIKILLFLSLLFYIWILQKNKDCRHQYFCHYCSFYSKQHNNNNLLWPKKCYKVHFSRIRDMQLDKINISFPKMF